MTNYLKSIASLVTAGTVYYLTKVSWDKSKNRFVVHVKNKHLGRFDNEIKAALFYDVAARAYFGEFAKTNFNLCPLTVGVSDA